LRRRRKKGDGRKEGRGGMGRGKGGKRRIEDGEGLGLDATDAVNRIQYLYSILKTRKCGF
jgi:hypothetical protein